MPSFPVPPGLVLVSRSVSQTSLFIVVLSECAEVVDAAGSRRRTTCTV